jgi:hypothetical protein
LAVFSCERLVVVSSIQCTGVSDIMSSRSFSDERPPRRLRLSSQAPSTHASEKRPGRQPKHWIAGVCRSFGRLTQLGFPRNFPIVQVPNTPLILAFVAGQVGGHVHGVNHDYASSVGYLAMTIWAYEELVHGVNWFRHLLGFAYVIIMAMRLAAALHA